MNPPVTGDRPVLVAGGGLAGSLMAVYLARQGHRVHILESRPDLRHVDIDAGRSINLALATRGIVPLIDIGVIDRVDEFTIPMRGRMIHVAGDPTPDLLRYGTKPQEVIHSVSRTDLNAVLLDAAEATGRVTIEFEARIDHIDLEQRSATLSDGRQQPFDVVFGADGAGSRVRAALVDAGACRASTDWLDHSYKELTLPPASDGRFQLDPNALHIWPRGELMLIALANPGGDFTVTLFAPTATFAGLTSAGEIQAFFATHFADFSTQVDDLVEQFTDNPLGRLGTLWADGWHLDDRAVLLGDAAHAIVPFHGQGMNAALESARLLDRFLRRHRDDRAAAFAAFEQARKPDTDAIAELALENYLEMRAGVVDPAYRAKRALSLELERRFRHRFSPRYNMVMFSTMPYREARERAIRQGDIVDRAIADPTTDVDALVYSLAPLPIDDPLVDPEALSVQPWQHDEFSYGSYLRVSELLSLQQCVSLDADTGRPEHDETLFIIIHQVYELWFKQLLHELDLIVRLLDASRVNEARHHLRRVLTILKVLVEQVDVLETMTPAEFASFRSFLANASGFQSAQFRELEFMLGIKDRVQLDWFDGAEADRLTDRYEAPTLWDSFVRLVDRAGFHMPTAALERDVRLTVEPDEQVQSALLACYGDDSFAGLCERLTDLDERLQEWRYRHVMMVKRTIGTKPGTGGSDGAAYLATTLFRPAFPDLWAIRTEF